MSTILALRSNVSRYDALGITFTPPYGGGTNLNVPGETPYGGEHLLIALKDGSDHWSVTWVEFDPDVDVLGTAVVNGHPGVIGLWLSSFTEGGVIATHADPALLGDIDPWTYPVPDLRPANNGYMARRGFVWPPGGSAHPYP